MNKEKNSYNSYNALGNKADDYGNVADTLWGTVKRDITFSEFDTNSRIKLFSARIIMQDAIKAYLVACNEVRDDYYKKRDGEKL